ncbi:MAG: 50S ribosomal protein L12 [Candidatus Pacearchaeota archaeon]|nr:50S ribosomal protein L12 [Candidatus Pacearchaeota archaeon]
MENVYAALLLHKLGKEINESNLKSVVAAAGGKTDESQIKSLVASLKGIDIAKELESASLVAAAPAAEKKEEKKPAHVAEEKKEAAAEGLSALFG